MNVKIGTRSLSGTVEIISSKSDAHRVFIAAALSESPTEIVLRGCSKDVQATISCLRGLGAEITQRDPDIWSVRPVNRNTESEIGFTATLNCGESGSTLRFLIPVAAALGKETELTGEG